MATAQSAVTFAVCVLMITELILAKRDYYDILGVPKDATERQIKKAFHKLAMKYHPDKNKSPDAEVRFREIAEGTVDSFFLGLFGCVKSHCFFTYWNIILISNVWKWPTLNVHVLALVAIVMSF